MTKAATSSPAPAVGRGVVDVVYKGHGITLAFGVNVVRAFADARQASGPDFVLELLKTDGDALTRGLCYHALRAALRAIGAPPPADEDEVGYWLDVLQGTEDPAAEAIGKAIGHALVTANPTIGAMLQTIAEKVSAQASSREAPTLGTS